MIKFNYAEPEFKVLIVKAEDVISTSLDIVDDKWQSDEVGGNELFSI